MNEDKKSLRLERGANGVARLVFDVPGESVNTLRASFAAEFEAALDEVDADTKIVALVLASAKSDSFVAGADISMLQSVSTAAEAAELSRVAQGAADRLAACRVPVVAAIHGACLGGGLELALACDERVATAHTKTKLGLPEVQLGILPGMGGTQRLPRLIGLTVALDLLLTGKQLNARRALKAGLINEVVAQGILLKVAEERALALSRREQGTGKSAWGRLPSADQLREIAMAENPLGRKVVFDQARKQLLSKTKGNYPAPEQILAVVRRGLEAGMKVGLEAEAEAFGELVVSPQAGALRHIYFSQQSLKKDSGAGGEAKRLSQLGVIGAGLMGAGVAFVSVVEAGARVRLKDVSYEGLQRGLSTLSELLDERMKRRRITPWQKSALLAGITRSTDYSGIKGLDLVIEAVFEDLELKRSVLRDVEQNGGEETIFASNTSSLPIASIAAEAQAPERVIGMHYFSPVQKMPLLEIITTEKTAPWVERSCVEFGRRQGKTVIVVGDGPGFYTTRILGPYLNEAAFALLEGRSVESIDAELVRAGFPVGPLALLDEVGIDVGTKVAKTLKEALGERVAPPKELAALHTAGRLGRKNQSGFYDYSKDSEGGKRPVDESVYAVLGLDLPGDQSEFALGGLSEPGSVAERCVLQMVNEAIHCLGEGILKTPRDGDIGAIFGLGFPPFLGGPFHFVDSQGASEILGRLRRLERQFGARFTPAPGLVKLAEEGGKFSSALSD